MPVGVENLRRGARRLFAFALVRLILTALLAVAVVAQIRFELPLFDESALLLLVAVLLVLHVDLYCRGLSSLAHGRPDADTLLTLGITAAVVWSFYGITPTDDPFFLPYIALTLTSLDVARSLTTLTDWRLLGRLPDKATAPFEPPYVMAKLHIPFEGRCALLLLIAAGYAGFYALHTVKMSNMDALFIVCSLLIASCPCSLPLVRAVPLMSAVFALQGDEMLVRRAGSLNAAAKVNVLIVGRSVLMQERSHVTDFMAEGIDETSLFSLAATAETGSYHPIAAAITDHAIRLRANFMPTSAFNEIPGQGVEVLVGGSTLRVGQAEWLFDEGVSISADLLTRADQLAERGKNVMFVSSGDLARGLIACQGEVQDDAPALIEELRSLGVFTVFVTSDNRRTTKAFAKLLQADKWIANCYEDELLNEIRSLQKQGKSVGLAYSRTGNLKASTMANFTVAPMGKTGSESPWAGVQLTTRNFSAIARLIKTSLTMRRLIRYNLIATFLGTIFVAGMAIGTLYEGADLYAQLQPHLILHYSLATAIPGLLTTLFNAFSSHD